MTISSHIHHAEERDPECRQVPPIYDRLAILGVVTNVRGDVAATEIGSTLIAASIQISLLCEPVIIFAMRR